ncbi:MAG: DUF4399 domain-containing protein [Verrucomicrobia bacterium]|nr:DUF4399 domain-containing protein [Verrucomicrobiota bacterium]
MKNMRSIPWMVLLGLLLPSPNFAQEEKPKLNSSPAGAKVYIVRPADGRTVKRKFKVVFGLTGMGVCPAGLTAADGTPFPDTGHHHLVINKEALPAMDMPLITDKPTDVLHFGKGQTETMLDLPPGKHTLQLIFADYAHVPHNPPVISPKITVTVED